MLRIIISEEGQRELDRLKFDVKTSINKIVKYIPEHDLKDISYIKVTDLPSKKSHNHKTSASYFRKHGIDPASIEIYLKNLYFHIKSDESFNRMRPIQEYGLASTIFHEVGHHHRIIQSHNIGKRQSERYADSYADDILKIYILRNAKEINICFENLENLSEEKNLSLDIINSMRSWWEETYKKAIK